MKTLVPANCNVYDYTNYVSLATGYFVLAILLTVIGSLVFYVKNNREQEIIEMKDIECREKTGAKSDDRRRASKLEVKTQLTQSEYNLDLDRMMSY